jgi:hypothetical protein
MIRNDKSFNIIIDTNIWISFLIGKNLKGLEKYLDSDKIKLITCDEQMQELLDVFKKPKIRKYISMLQVEEFFDLLEEKTDKIQLITSSDLCRDKKDNYLISLIIDSKADYLITGDADLLVLNPINQTQIISYSDFNSILKLL